VLALDCHRDSTSIVGAYPPAPVFAIAAGSQGFAEEFSLPTLDPAWEVVEFTGSRVYGYSSPANHYSLTDNPGQRKATGPRSPPRRLLDVTKDPKIAELPNGWLGVRSLSRKLVPCSLLELSWVAVSSGRECSRLLTDCVLRGGTKPILGEAL
jgi:hypothetical protein